MLFDSHAHINNQRYDDKKLKSLVRDIEESDVSYVMDVGFDLESSVRAIEHASKFPWCYAVVGCHPHEAKTMDENTMIMFKGLLKKPKVKAVGEIGLDYHYNFSEPEVQQYWFRRQIQLALENSMPIVIHDREAHQDVMEILKQEGAFSKNRTDQFPKQPNGLPDAKVLLHCYSGSREMAEQYIKLGATISIAGPVTYKNARKLIEVAKAIPIEHLLIETDSPYLTPVPHRGKPNKPPYVEFVARKIAAIKDMSYEEVAKITCENARRFFGI
ncbi:MAG: TatD family hydrolase [Clostridiales bacterium]|nr:TatD family hydrolase [Clostridiales bacterium]